MKEVNKVKLMRVATILTQIDNGGRAVNGNADVFMGSVHSVNMLGRQIIEIIEDELNSPQTYQESREKGTHTCGGYSNQP